LIAPIREKLETSHDFIRFAFRALPVQKLESFSTQYLALIVTVILFRCLSMAALEFISPLMPPAASARVFEPAEHHSLWTAHCLSIQILGIDPAHVLAAGGEVLGCGAD